MTPTERGLLDAIVAEPADDTVRLVYADWLDENGQPARGEFIRVQIEAERHHVHSARHAALDSRAHALLQEHWIDWWLPVCEAVGLPFPDRSARGRPYGVGRNIIVAGDDDGLALKGFQHGVLLRGFPDYPCVDFENHGPGCGAFLQNWPTVGPFTGMIGIGPEINQWALLDGPHFNQIRSLDLLTQQPDVWTAVFDSPHLISLEDVRMYISTPDDVQRLIQHPRALHLRGFGLPVTTRGVAEVLAGSAAFKGLTSLSVTLDDEPTDPPGSTADERLLILAGSPHFQGLHSLALDRGLTPDGLQAACALGHWKSLRRLRLQFDGNVNPPFDLPEAGLFPNLEELDFYHDLLDTRLVSSLVRSPLLKQLRHFTLGTHRPHNETPDLSFLVDAVDPTRIETLAVYGIHIDPAAVAGLRQTFGERLRLL